MPRRELSTSDMKIEQNAPIDLGKADLSPDRESPIIRPDCAMGQKEFDALAFNEEPVTILISPSSEKNAPTSYPVWNNGKGAEVLIKGQWQEWKYLPVNVVLTTKRKYVESLLRAKMDRVETIVPNPGDPDLERFPGGKLLRFTSGLCTFSIIEDKNPAGAEWAMRIRQQNF